MVPKNSERRHRLNSVEVDPVLEAVEFQLKRLLEEKDDLLAASILFRVYFRLREYVTSRPSYPPHNTWKEISSYLCYGTVSRKAGANERITIAKDLFLNRELLQ